MTGEERPDDAPANGNRRQGQDVRRGTFILGDGIGVGCRGGDIGGTSMASAPPPPHAGDVRGRVSSRPMRATDEERGGASAGDGGGGEHPTREWEGREEGLKKRGGGGGHWRGEESRESRDGGVGFSAAVCVCVVLETSGG